MDCPAFNSKRTKAAMLRRMIRCLSLAVSLGVGVYAMSVTALEPDPFLATKQGVRQYLRDTNFTDTALNRRDYLKAISGMVDYFRHFQAEDGRIKDPYLRREIQYSTPCYAWAAAALVVGNRQTNLLDSAARALENALQQLADATPCDRHGDFFTVPCMFAYENLKGLVPPERRKKWETLLTAMDPQRCYSDLPLPSRQRMGNWNLVATAGEFLRKTDGFTGMEYVDASLPKQIPSFTSAGMYLDPKVPMAYDHFPRHYMAIMLERGYRGEENNLAELIARAAWTSMLMQSPRGELPTGGRSAQHQWNEAQQCVTYEIFARRSQRAGDEVSARAFKRAAHLALESINRWIRPSGELNIVKNYFDPALRHGFEGYSSHSQYNLLAASMMAVAWNFADDEIPEGRCPAEVGGFVIQVPEFHKVIANAGGLYLEIDTSADSHYNSTGLIRVHKTGVDSLVGPSDSAPAEIAPLAVGIAWQQDGKWIPLAGLTDGQIKKATVTVQEERPSRVRFAVNFEVDRDAVHAVRMEYELTPDYVRVIAEVEGETPQVRVTFPALLFDGKDSGQVAINGSEATIKIRASQQRFTVETPLLDGLKLVGDPVKSRNGFLGEISGECAGRRVIYTLRPQAVSTKLAKKATSSVRKASGN